MKPMDNLYDGLWGTALSYKKHDFVKFMAKRVDSLFKDVSFDHLTVRFFQIRENGQIDIGLRCHVHGLPRYAVPKYEKNMEHDPITPQVINQLGKALISEQFQHYEQWSETLIVKQYCLQMDIHAATMIGFRIPGEKRKFLMFYYTHSDYQWYYKLRDMKKLRNFRFQLEYLCVPFLFCWLYQYDRLDKEILDERLEALRVLTPLEYQHLKAFISEPMLSRKLLAQHYPELGSEGNIKKQLDSIFNKCFAHLTESKSRENRYDRGLLLFNKFWFLKEVIVVSNMND